MGIKEEKMDKYRYHNISGLVGIILGLAAASILLTTILVGFLVGGQQTKEVELAMIAKGYTREMLSGSTTVQWVLPSAKCR